MIYKEKIVFLRERNNLNQKELAEIIGISKARYCFYENEKEIIPLKHLITICNYFNVSLDYTLSFTNIKQYTNSIQDINNNISGKKLKEFRKENKITQEKLAKVLNTNQSVIANYERGRTLIATPFLYTVCKKYNISADYLLGKVDNPKYLK